MTQLRRQFMSNRIPEELYNTVHDFYVKHLGRGVQVSKIANLFNAFYGTDFAESSLRNRYEYQRDLGNVEADIIKRMNEIEEAERKIALKEMHLVSRQKKLQRQQSSIDSVIRYNADKELVAEIFKEVGEDQEFEPVDLGLTIGKQHTGVPIYNMSDDHLGYHEDGYYSIAQAEKHLKTFFEYVNGEIERYQYKEIVISHTGDQIEGSTLKATQLSIIAEVMSKQAVRYATLFTEYIKQLSKQNPKTSIQIYFVDEDNHSQIRVNGASRGDTTEMLSKVIANDIRRTVETAHEFGGLTNVNFEHAGAIFAEVDGKNVMFIHGHQLPRPAKLMAQRVFDVYGVRPDLIIHGHYHSYAMTTLNDYKGYMQTVISAPAIVGDTRYGREGLGLTGLSGVLKIKVSDGAPDVRFVKL